MLSLIRAVYTGLLIKKEYAYKDKADKRHARQAEVLRRDEWYGSDEEGDIVVGTEKE